MKIKTVYTIIIAAFFLTALVACARGADPDESATSGSPDAAGSAQTETPGQEETQTPMQPPTVEPRPTPSLAPVQTANAPSGPNEYSSAEIGDTILFGGFNWLVIDVTEDSTLILSEKILEFMAYHNTPEELTWEQCDMREYLNGDFFENTFSDEEKALVLDSTLENDDNQWFMTPGGNDTVDKVFSLSLGEVIRLFGDSGQLDEPEFDSWIGDEYNEARIGDDADDEPSWWWLRSPGRLNDLAVLVADDGFIFVAGAPIISDVMGLRPALRLAR